MRRTILIAAAHIAATSIALTQASAIAASEGAGGPAFVPMQEIVVPIVDGPRAYGRLRVKLVILAHDPAAIPSIQAQMPALRETALIATAEFARLYASPYMPVDARRLSRDLSAALIAHDQGRVMSRILLVSVLAERS